MNTLQTKSSTRRTAFKFSKGNAANQNSFETTTDTGNTTSVPNTTTTTVSILPTCLCPPGLK